MFFHMLNPARRYFKHFTADEMKELKSGRPLKKKYFKIRAKQLVCVLFGENYP